MNDDRHWLYRPQNLPRLWKWGAALLALSVVAEFFVNLHSSFGFAGWFAFYALFGFFSCLVMVVFAKWLGGWVKRPEDYYAGGPDDDASGQGGAAESPAQDGLDGAAGGPRGSRS